MFPPPGTVTVPVFLFDGQAVPTRRVAELECDADGVALLVSCLNSDNYFVARSQIFTQ